MKPTETVKLFLGSHGFPMRIGHSPPVLCPSIFTIRFSDPSFGVGNLKMTPLEEKLPASKLIMLYIPAIRLHEAEFMLIWTTGTTLSLVKMFKIIPFLHLRLKVSPFGTYTDHHHGIKKICLASFYLSSSYVPFSHVNKMNCIYSGT